VILSGTRLSRFLLLNALGVIAVAILQMRPHRRVGLEATVVFAPVLAAAEAVPDVAVAVWDSEAVGSPDLGGIVLFSEVLDCLIQREEAGVHAVVVVVGAGAGVVLRH
jgi:hypothetical protein